MLAKYSDIDLPRKNGLIKRIGKKNVFEHYNRLVFLVFLINLLILNYGIAIAKWWANPTQAAIMLGNLVLANFTVAIIFRQQYVINFLFWLATRAPTSWPLAIRWHLGKVYHFGGLHSGSAMAGTAWYAIFVATSLYGVLQPAANSGTSALSNSFVVLIIAQLGLLCFIVLTAHPKIRAKFHNFFEMAHRFGGWSALLIFWAQNLILTRDMLSVTPSSEPRSLSVFDTEVLQAFVSNPASWVLCLLTFSVVLPWLRLKKVTVDIAKPSSHVALVKFDHGVTPFPGSSTAVSRNPLIEWHSFANVPAPGENGFRLTISRAGDWTGDFIDDCPKKVWVKGIPTAGVANIEVLFKRVVYIATGSGIGPVLPHLLAKQVPAHLVWSTRNPRQTYGDQLVDEILEAEPNAFIWDTTANGKPDMVKLAYAAYVSFNAEAVICIANQKLTQQVVYGMESRGIPAYGAIWDS